MTNHDHDGRAWGNAELAYEICDVREVDGQRKMVWKCCGEWARGVLASLPEEIEAEAARTSTPEFLAGMAELRERGAKNAAKGKYGLATGELVGRFVRREI